MLAAAREGTDAPALGAIVSYSGADGTLMDERVRGWAQELYALAAASDAPASDLISWLGDVQSSGVEVSRAEPEEAGGAHRLPGLCAVRHLPALWWHRGDRLPGAGESPRSRRAAQGWGRRASRMDRFAVRRAWPSGFCGVLVWALNGALGFMVYRDALAGRFDGGGPAHPDGASRAGARGHGILAFCCGSWACRTRWRTPVANIASMVLTFLAGTWVSIDQMGPAIESIARLTPGYWCVQGIVRGVRGAPDHARRGGGTWQPVPA